MLFVLTNSFLDKELKALKKYYSLEDVKKTLVKTNISAVNLSHLGYENGKLLKLRIVNKVAGRMIVYVYSQKDYIVPIIIRLKKDKIFGENLSLKNKKAKNLILKMLNLVMLDIEKNKYKKEDFC